MSLIDYNFFNSILPFDQLPQTVQSDHAEIAVKTQKQHVINVWNISNPAYHCYFQYGDKPAFKNTHLFVEKSKIKDDLWLKEKIASQIDTITGRFIQQQVSIQVVVEGYESFYSSLENTIKQNGHHNFKIISVLNQKPENWNPEWNVTGLLIDTSRFSLLEEGVIFKKYQESADGNKEKEFTLPYAHLQDRSNLETIVVAGVHVNGCASQYPKSGLKTLIDTVEELRKKTIEKSDVIALGDFNTPPKYLQEVLADTNVSLLNVPYLTHVNPSSQAAIYDHAVVLGKKSSYEVMPSSFLSKASQDFVCAIEKSRQNYLKGVL